MHPATHSPRYQRINLALLLLMAMLSLGALFLVPLVGLPHSAWWGLALAPVALLANSFWALHHEAIHGGFSNDRRTNVLAGRIMAVLLGSSFHVLRFGHLMHHRYNRNPIDRPDTYDPARTTKAKARPLFLANLLFGLYLAELLAPLASLLPRPLIKRILDRIYAGGEVALQAIRAASYRLFLEPRHLRMIRTDALLAAMLIALSAIAFGSYWPMLAAFLATRAMLISVLDNVYHYGTPIDRPDHARNLSLPASLQLLLLNMNLHRVHHRRPAVPWWALPAALRANGDGYDAPLLGRAIAQFAGPIAASELVSRATPAPIQIAPRAQLHSAIVPSQSVDARYAAARSRRARG